MTLFSDLAIDWLPPALVRWLRQRRRANTRFEGEFATWEKAASRCAGYDADDILSKVLAATLKVINGEAVFERDSILFAEVEYSWPVLAALLWGAARNGGNLNVLDFGGALGSSYFQHRNVLQCLPNLSWNIVEQPHYVEVGNLHIKSNNLNFYKNIDEYSNKNKPNVVLLSSVLQYLKDPLQCISNIISLDSDVIVVDRTIVNDSDRDVIYVQRVFQNIYVASYPCYSLSEKKLISTLCSRYQMVSSFDSLPFPSLSQINSKFKGYVFSKACR